MENKETEKINFFKKISLIIKNYKRLFIGLFLLFFAVLLGSFYFNYNKNLENKEISEKYIKAGLFLSSKKNQESKKIYQEIVLSKNKFYSLLALNTIIDNNLESNNNEVLKLFNTVEHIKYDREQKNLIKLKKALFLIKISKQEEGDKLLSEIISDNSVWKETAINVKSID